MAFVPLQLSAPDDRVNAALDMFTRPYLEQAHHLLCYAYGHEYPNQHFGRSAAVMTVLAIAAASVVPGFDFKSNKNLKGDRSSFVDRVHRFFPWYEIGIVDDQFRRGADLHRAAAEKIYSAIRNPIVHSGGVVGKSHPRVRIRHAVPGRSPEKIEEEVVLLCIRPSLEGQTVLELAHDGVTIYTKEMYWCAREMIERMSVDPEVQTLTLSSLA